MTRSLPPLGWLRTFEVAARHLNFTAAASELAMTQSAVSQQIRSLEMRLGHRLFERKPRGLAQTDCGRALLPKVGSAFASLESAMGELGAQRTPDDLTVATSVSVVQWLLAPNLGAFMQSNPHVRLQLISSIWPDEFRQARADVEIRFGSAKQVGEGAERLGPDRLIAVAAPERASSVSDQPLIEAIGTSEGWMEWAQATNGTTALAPTFRVDSYGTAVDLACHGHGVALVSSLIAQMPLAASKLTQIHPLQLPSTEGYFLAVNSKTTAALGFADWLKSLVTTQLD